MAAFDESPEDRLVNEAEEFMRQGRFQDAVGRYEELCLISPSDVMVRLGYASALECAGDLNEAERVVSEVASKNAHNINIHRFQHLFFERREDYNRAILCQEMLREHEGLEEGPLDQLADLYFNQGRYHEALKELERIHREEHIDDDSFLASILGRIGACYRQAGRNSHALDYLERALEREPDNHWLLTELAETKRIEEAYDDARDAYCRALEVMPDDQFARSRLAQLEFEDGNTEEAIRLYEDILIDQPKAHWAMVELAQIIGSSDSERSKQLCEDALDIDPSFPAAYSQLGQLARQQQDLDQARKHYLNALDSMPNANWILHELADIANQLDRTDEAQTHLDRARINDPFDPVSYGVQADFLRQQNKLSEAIAYLRKAVELDPKYNWAWRELAEIQAICGDNDAADLAFEEYNKLEQNLAYSDGLRAFLLRHRGQFDASVPYLERAVIEQEDYFWAWRELIEHYLQFERYEVAEEKAKNAIKSVGNHPALWGMLSEALRQQRKFPEAIHAIEQALELNQDIPQLWALRAELFLQNDNDEAIRSAKRACQLDDAVEYQILYAQCLIQTDKIEEAQQVVIDVIENDHHDAYLYDMASEIALRQGDRDASLLWADRGLEHNSEHRRLLLRRASIAVERKEEQAAELLQAASKAPGQQAWRDFITPFAQLGDINNARRYAYLAIDQHRDRQGECARIWTTLAEAELLHKHSTEAKQALHEALCYDNHCLPAHLLIGMIAEQDQEFDSAEYHLRTVYESCLNEQDLEIDMRLLLRQLAHIEEQRHQQDSARDYLQLLQEHSAYDVSTKIDSAAFELRNGNQIQAEQTLLEILDQDQERTDRHQRNRCIHNLAWYYLQRDSAEAAHTWLKQHLSELDLHGILLAAQLALAHGSFKDAQEHIELIPDSKREIDHRRILARAFIGQTQYKRAEHLLSEINQRDPSDEESAVLLGECLAYQGLYQDALEILQHKQLSLVANDERLFLVACILLESESSDHCLAWMGHKPPQMVNEIPLKRVFQTAFSGIWFDRDCPTASDKDLLALPPFPKAMHSLAQHMDKHGHDALASQCLVLAHSLCLEQNRIKLAKAVASDCARLLKQLKQNKLARYYAWRSDSWKHRFF